MFRNKDYILTVYREKSFSKAAQKLYISQPSLSAVVKRVEEKLSAPIFNRTTPITLTDVGKKYIQHALEIEDRELDIEKYVADLSNLLTGKITVGGSSLFSAFVLPGMISAFTKNHPKIEFEIFEDNTKNLVKKLDAGTVDIVIDNAEINDKNINSVLYKLENLLLAVPQKFKINEELKDYRFTAADIKSGKHHTDNPTVDIKRFSDLPFILLNPENDTGKRADTIFKKYNINPEVIFYLEQQVTAYNMSCSGLGISFVSDTLINHTPSEPSLYYYCLPNEIASRDIYFYTKSNRYLSHACQKFIEFTNLN